MRPKALITGATGFIGSHLVETLVADKWELTCWIRPDSCTDWLSQLPVSLIRGNLDDHHLLRKAVKNQDYIFHLAARIFSAPKEIYQRTNCDFTKNLINACLEEHVSFKRFVYVSSISAAGPSEPNRFTTESKTCQPTSEYGRTKLLGEKAVRRAWDKLPATIIRPPNVYGPRQKEMAQLSRLIQKHIVPKLRSKDKITSLIYVKDLIRGLLMAAHSPQALQKIYYMTDGRSYSWREIILTLKDHILGNSLFLPLPESFILFLAWAVDMMKRIGLIQSFFGRRAWQTMTRTPWLFSSEKAKAELGFTAKYTLGQGIKETIAYYQK